MVALKVTKELRYAGSQKLPGEIFEASEKDAKILVAIGKAERAEVAPANPTNLPLLAARGANSPDTALRDAREEYERTFSKRPFHKWSVDELHAKINAYRRRDMRAEGE